MRSLPSLGVQHMCYRSAASGARFRGYLYVDVGKGMMRSCNAAQTFIIDLMCVGLWPKGTVALSH